MPSSAAGAQLLGDLEGGGGRDGEAEVDRTGLGGYVGLADPDHGAGEVGERAAVAGADGGVGLDEVDQSLVTGGSGPGIARPSPETIPALTVLVKPSGLPRVITLWPTCGSAVAKRATGGPLRPAWSTAMSVIGSAATRRTEQPGPAP
jgi:hypothetical protein